MSLTALVLAAAVSGAPASETVPASSFDVYRRALPEHCQLRALLTRKTVNPTSGKLADMPKADLHLTVDRRLNGCPVPTIVRYSYEGDGRTTKPRAN